MEDEENEMEEDSVMTPCVDQTIVEGFAGISMTMTGTDVGEGTGEADVERIPENILLEDNGADAAAERIPEDILLESNGAEADAERIPEDILLEGNEAKETQDQQRPVSVADEPRKRLQPVARRKVSYQTAPLSELTSQIQGMSLDVYDIGIYENDTLQVSQYLRSVVGSSQF